MVLHVVATSARRSRRARRKRPPSCDLDALRGSFAALRDAFPEHWTHALAIKAAPLAFVVREAVDAGLGVEAASYGEAASALANGCPRERVVFDSPAKTVDELRWALDAGIAVNADSLDELARIDAVLAERSAPSASLLGLRVNACVDGKGEHAIFAVSENDSKFGHPLSSDAMRAAVVDAFGAYPWLRALHTHVGSAGTSLDMLAQGASTLAGLADEIDAAAGGRRVEALDIGGGLASSMASDETSPTFAEHAACLREAAPSLFTRDDRAVFTELGRALLQKTAWIVSQVEYVKAFDGSPTRIATLQVGADLLMRQCYRPELATNRIARTTPTPSRSRRAAAAPSSSTTSPARSASRATTRRRASRCRRSPEATTSSSTTREPTRSRCGAATARASCRPSTRTRATRRAPSSSYCRSRPSRSSASSSFGLEFKFVHQHFL